MIEKGQRVSINYVGTFDDGTVFDRSQDHDDTFDFVVGAGNVIPGFEEAVMDMEIGDKKTVVIPPEQAYGNYDEKLIDRISVEELADAEKIVERVGQTVCFDDEKGNFTEAKILSVEDGMVTFDFNHPMAGKTLNFEIELVEVTAAGNSYAKPVNKPVEPAKPGERA